jgi:hypothetical protein
VVQPKECLKLFFPVHVKHYIGIQTKQMKNTTLTLLMLLTLICVQAQSTQKTASYITTKEANREIIAYHTDKKDTLYIADTETGKMIRMVWDDKRYSEEKPVIIMTKDIYAVVQRYQKKTAIKKPIKR